MNDSDKWDRLLKQALAAAAEPKEQLNDALLKRWEERNRMKYKLRKRWYAGALVCAVMLVASVTAVAATHLFTPKEVAQQLGHHALAEAFAGPEAVAVEQSAVSGGYKVTLHGIVSGEGLTAFDDAGDIRSDKTYAVVSIAKEDGTPMPDTRDPDYGKESFFVSPLIKGELPWQVNIATMKGGYSEFVADGVMYRLIECDAVEVFADRGVYLAVSNTLFFSKDAFAYDDATGEVRPNPAYPGVAVLFDLPLDESKADPERGEAYLQQIAAPAADNRDEAALSEHREALQRRIEQGTVIPESVLELMTDAQGNPYYEFDDWHTLVDPDSLFAEGETGFSNRITVSGFPDGTAKALQFHKDEQGVITGRIIVLN